MRWLLVCCTDGIGVGVEEREGVCVCVCVCEDGGWCNG